MVISSAVMRAGDESLAESSRWGAFGEISWRQLLSALIGDPASVLENRDQLH